MDKRVKLAAAASVLFGGMVAACMFRHESPRGSPAVSRGGGQLVLRRQVASPPHLPLTPAGGGIAGPSMADTPGRGRAATVLRPMDPAEPPPVLAKNYPGIGTSAGSGWPSRMEMMPRYAARRGNSARTHKIVDGDTLETLAERYLGSAERSSEIYEANHDVLASPQVLPIGATLTIPCRERRSVSDSDAPPKRPVVPVQR